MCQQMSRLIHIMIYQLICVLNLNRQNKLSSRCKWGFQNKVSRNGNTHQEPQTSVRATTDSTTRGRSCPARSAQLRMNEWMIWIVQSRQNTRAVSFPRPCLILSYFPTKTTLLLFTFVPITQNVQPIIVQNKGFVWCCDNKELSNNKTNPVLMARLLWVLFFSHIIRKKESKLCSRPSSLLDGRRS